MLMLVHSDMAYAVNRSILSKVVWGPPSLRPEKAQAQNSHPEKQTKTFSEYTVLL